ncbi:extracellular solute-binding protein [Actinospica durhamensis]|uniref:Extracellular solute-binding protein n=1 Tax=Actinospica durhamensis TaxID=1508375 RepID=A0A941EYM6_9ACTN|nr:extracellular solute-binding protein [Actinospica durhamensis]MBR7838807.1 extracellular solute-binding protein [Actinospica durhamensis]
MKFPRPAKGAVCALAATALVAGCSSSGSTNTGSSSNSNSKVTLTFWSWVPNMDKVVAVWNQSHPDIQIKFTEAAGGDAELAKLLTAGKAGDMPDIAQIEYQSLPTMVTNNYLADISSYDSNLKSDFPSGLWNQVTLGQSQLYGVPQDAAPLAFFYRTDVFKKYNLAVPTTWAQYASEAVQLHKDDPSIYMGDTVTTDAGLFSGLSQQAGAQWWSTSGTSWSVGINSTASQKVASYWGNLVQEGALDSQTAWTASWDKSFSSGEYASWISAVWAPGDLASQAANTSGDWAMAELPQWAAGDDVDGAWGGSATSVTSDSKHAQQAAEFIAWLNQSSQGTDLLVKDGSIYPASLSAESSSSLPASSFMNQSDFYTLAKQFSASTAAATWGPDVNVAYSDFGDDFASTVKTEAGYLSALDKLQNSVIADMKSANFTISGS